jgi:hypothetical protein
MQPVLTVYRDKLNAEFFQLPGYKNWECLDCFLEQDKIKSGQCKGTGNAVSSGELFGFLSSFRKMNVD